MKADMRFIHFLSHHLELSGFKEYPMEIAEVASMAMELFSMENWEIYFSNAEDLRRAKIQQLERVITIFPWIATIDKFQHWVYENPNHTMKSNEQRTGSGYIMSLIRKLLTGADLKGIKKISGKNNCIYLKCRFYYIEYGIAQLGAIGLWKQFKKNNGSGFG